MQRNRTLILDGVRRPTARHVDPEPDAVLVQVRLSIGLGTRHAKHGHHRFPLVNHHPPVRYATFTVQRGESRIIADQRFDQRMVVDMIEGEHACQDGSDVKREITLVDGAPLRIDEPLRARSGNQDARSAEAAARLDRELTRRQ